MVLAASLLLATAPAVAAGPVLDRIEAAREIRIGVRADAAPFSYMQDGEARGFTVDLCRRASEALRLSLGLPVLRVVPVTVTAEDRFDALSDGRIDLLCGATTVTLEREEIVDFTIPIFATGVAALTGPAADPSLRRLLAGRASGDMSLPRLGRALEGARIGARAGTTAEAWLRDNLPSHPRQPMHDHRAGIAAVSVGSLDVYFADQAILKGQLGAGGARGELELSAFTFTYEPYALAMPLGDDDLRITLNLALSAIFREDSFFSLYEQSFGSPSPDERLFYNTSLGPD